MQCIRIIFEGERTKYHNKNKNQIEQWKLIPKIVRHEVFNTCMKITTNKNQISNYNK